MSILERRIERAVCKYAKRKGVFVTKFTSPGHRGVPDRIFWVKGGAPLLIEFKAQGAVLSALQGYIKTKLELLGYEVKVISSINAGKSAVDTALEAARLSGEGQGLAVKARRRGAVLHPRAR